MVKDAEAHAAEDKKMKETIEARNHADALIHTTEKTLKENEGKVPASDKEAIEKAVQELKDVLDSSDADKIKEKTDALMQISMKMGEAMYKQQADASAAGSSEQPQSDAKKDDETVVDADFEEVKK